MVFFCENSLQIKVVNNFGKKLHFKICYGVLNMPWVFVRFTSIIDLFSSPNIFKFWLNDNSVDKRQFDNTDTSTMFVMLFGCFG